MEFFKINRKISVLKIYRKARFLPYKLLLQKRYQNLFQYIYFTYNCSITKRHKNPFNKIIHKFLPQKRHQHLPKELCINFPFKKDIPKIVLF